MSIEFIRTTDFTPDYESFVRVITNPNGRGNSAYDMEKEKSMLPQDALIKQRTIVHGNCGISCEFLWNSGRQDVWLQLDVADPAVEVVENHRQLINALKERYGDGTRLT